MKQLKIKKNNLDIFFNFLSNKIYFKETPVKFLNEQFVSSMLININVTQQLDIKFYLWVKERNLFFITLFFKLYFSIVQHINKLSLQNGFFIKLDLIGLGFRINKISEKLFFFSLGWANGVYFIVPEALRVYILSKKRQLIVFSFDVNKVYNIISMLILLRKTRPYRITGFVNPVFIQRLRSGKQR